MVGDLPPEGPAPPPPLERRRRRTPSMRLRRFSGKFFSRDWRGGLAVVVVLLLLLVVLTIPLGAAPTGQLSAYDDDWNDISKFRGDMEHIGFLNLSVRTVSTSATTLLEFNDTRNMLYVAIGIERAYSFSEWRAIRKFLDRGGTVLIADDYGHGNSILKYNGLEDNPAISHLGDTPESHYVWSGERLADVNVDRNPLLVKVRVPIWEGLEYEVLLNDPSCFVENDDWNWEPWMQGNWQGSPPAQYIANSTASGWIDEDRNGVRDPGEQVGEYPVMLFMNGMLLISDPSLFTNDMYDRADNRLFAHAVLARLLPFGGTVIIDESIHLEPGLLSELDDVLMRPMYMILGESWPIWGCLMILVIGVAGLGAAGKRAPKRYEPHRNRLSEPRTLEFGNPYNWLADYYEVRGVLLQRMRYAYGLDPDDLQRLPPEIVAQLLGDQYLVQFVLQPVRVDPMALQAALGDITAWKPPENAEYLVERAEQYLRSLSDDAVQDWATPWQRHQGGMGR
ncbi:MAG: hypothetical protein JSW25_10000 [Thermoplasmata archaeon]|nr:MAG: hypothetical protein JSW25_10000 [Thermoplasmata archaeon]